MKIDPFSVIEKYRKPLEPKLEDRPKEHRSIDPTEGPIVAVKITSSGLDADIWLALKEDFKPDEGEPLAVFYAHELPILATKDVDQLREIYKGKLTFGPGSRVRR